MTSGANGEWVRQGTPQDDSADWNEEQSEYGTAVSPTEWDDYSSEQSVPVAPPRSEAAGGVPTAGSPGTPEEYEVVTGQEPDAAEEYRSEESEAGGTDAPAGDADDAVPDTGDDHVEVTPEARDEHISNEGAYADEAADGHLGDEGYDESASDEPTRDESASGETTREESAPVESVPEGPEPVESAPGESPLADSASDEHTHHVARDDAFDSDDMEATQAVPVAASGGSGATAVSASSPVPDGLYRGESTREGEDPGGQTTVMVGEAYPEQDVPDDVEEERLRARLDAERQAREQRLGAVPTSPDNATREDTGPQRVTTDRFLPSLGLFILRIVTAGILGVASYQILGSGVDETANFLEGYPLIPEPRLVAWILGFTLGAMALLLIIGLLQRVVGFLLLAIAVGSLIFIRWGNFSIFNAQVEGFIGDRDLLLAAVGLLLVTMGGGAWGIDGAFRRARAESKAERQG